MAAGDARKRAAAYTVAMFLLTNFWRGCSIQLEIGNVSTLVRGSPPFAAHCAA